MNKLRSDIRLQLQQDIMRMEGFRAASGVLASSALGPLQQAFPAGVFPLATVHEFMCSDLVTLAASSAFISALISPLVMQGGTIIWVSADRKLFPPSLAMFGLRPDNVLFVDVKKKVDVNWATEESLKCGAATVVVSESDAIDLTTSRRMQLAAEQSQSTAFFLLKDTARVLSTPATSRWRVRPAPSYHEDGMPGVGFPQWQVGILKFRHGRTGDWLIRWKGGRFEETLPSASCKALTGQKNKIA